MKWNVDGGNIFCVTSKLISGVGFSNDKSNIWLNKIIRAFYGQKSNKNSV